MKSPMLKSSIRRLAPAIVSLVAGVIIYYLSENNSWIINTPGLQWVRYNLPDGLWMFAFTWTILWIWGFKRNSSLYFYYLLSLGIGIAIELLQKNNTLPGTYDFLDLIFILIGGLVPIVVLSFKSK